MKRRHLSALMVLLLGLFWGATQATAEEPAPGVARISLIHGDVSTQRGDSGDWVAATLNAPVVRSDRISTGARSRTEVELDYANILRLDQSTEATIADLTRSRMQVQVAQGMINYTVLKGSETQAEIDTPNVAVQPLSEGSYRIQVDSNSQTEVIVRKGEAQVSTPQGSTTVKKGQVITIRGTDNPEYQSAEAPAKDEWDRWNGDRDHIIRDAESWRRTSPYYTGSEDLDRYGRWVYVPGYGEVWSPYAAPGWVPTAMAAGCGSLIGDGPGCPTSLGVGPRTTTGVGSIGEVLGAGGRDLWSLTPPTTPFGRPPMFRSLA